MSSRVRVTFVFYHDPNRTTSGQPATPDMWPEAFCQRQGFPGFQLGCGTECSLVIRVSFSDL